MRRPGAPRQVVVSKWEQEGHLEATGRRSKRKGPQVTAVREGRLEPSFGTMTFKSPMAPEANIDRIACPWLIKRFIDPDAEFLFVARDHEPLPPVARSTTRHPWSVWSGGFAVSPPRMLDRGLEALPWDAREPSSIGRCPTCTLSTLVKATGSHKAGGT